MYIQRGRSITMKKGLRRYVSIVLMVGMAAGFSGCGGSSGSSGTKEAMAQSKGMEKTEVDYTVLRNYAVKPAYKKVTDALEKIGIRTVDEFSEAFQKEDPLAFFLKLQEEDGSLQPEAMFRLMKKVEREVLLTPLVEKKSISENALRSIDTIGKPLCQLKRDTLRPFRDTGADDGIKEAFYQDVWQNYNEILDAYGVETLTYEEFTALRKAVEDLRPYFNYYATQMQNVVTQTDGTGVGMTTRDSAGRVLNPVVENTLHESTMPQVFGSYAPNLYRACQGVAVNYPQMVMGYAYKGEVDGSPLFGEVDVPGLLMGDDEEGRRYFQINRKGLAVLRLKNRSSASVPFTLMHEGRELVNVSIPSGESRRIYLPVTESACVFRIPWRKTMLHWM
jgi:hypothetical protein